MLEIQMFGSENELCMDNPFLDRIEASDSSSIIIEMERYSCVPSYQVNNFTGFGSLDGLTLAENSNIARPRFRRSSLPIEHKQSSKSHMVFANLPAANSTHHVHKSDRFRHTQIPRSDEPPAVDISHLNLTDETFWKCNGEKIGFFEVVAGYFRISDPSASNFPQKLWNGIQLSESGLSKWLGVRFASDTLVEFEQGKFSRILGMESDLALWDCLSHAGFVEVARQDVASRFADLAERCNTGCHYFEHRDKIFKKDSPLAHLAQIQKNMVMTNSQCL